MNKTLIDTERLEALARELLVEIGEDPEREGLKETPGRWARWWSEFMSFDPGKVGTTFEAIETDQMVCVTGMRVWSLCEHHLLPFWADISVAYITRKKVLGLSKFARIAQAAAHKLQIQERLVQEIADQIQELTENPDVAVVADGVHLCMVMRGIKTPGVMRSSILRGVFMEKPEARQEFLSIISRNGHG